MQEGPLVVGTCGYSDELKVLLLINWITSNCSRKSTSLQMFDTVQLNRLSMCGSSTNQHTCLHLRHRAWCSVLLHIKFEVDFVCVHQHTPHCNKHKDCIRCTVNDLLTSVYREWDVLVTWEGLLQKPNFHEISPFSILLCIFILCFKVNEFSLQFLHGSLLRWHIGLMGERFKFATVPL